MCSTIASACVSVYCGRPTGQSPWALGLPSSSRGVAHHPARRSVYELVVRVEWTKSPGVQLEGRSGDWKLELPANKVEIAFNDGSNDWDTPGYGQNYTINSPGSYRITGGKVKEL